MMSVRAYLDKGTRWIQYVGTRKKIKYTKYEHHYIHYSPCAHLRVLLSILHLIEVPQRVQQQR